MCTEPYAKPIYVLATHAYLQEYGCLSAYKAGKSLNKPSSGIGDSAAVIVAT